MALMNFGYHRNQKDKNFKMLKVLKIGQFSDLFSQMARGIDHN